MKRRSVNIKEKERTQENYMIQLDLFMFPMVFSIILQLGLAICYRRIRQLPKVLKKKKFPQILINRFTTNITFLFISYNYQAATSTGVKNLSNFLCL